MRLLKGLPGECSPCCICTSLLLANRVHLLVVTIVVEHLILGVPCNRLWECRLKEERVQIRVVEADYMYGHLRVVGKIISAAAGLWFKQSPCHQVAILNEAEPRYCSQADGELRALSYLCLHRDP